MVKHSKQKDIKVKNGYVLPYVLLLTILLLNIFILTVRVYLNEVNYYKSKHNQYQIRVYEERGKRIIVKNIEANSVHNLQTEIVYFEQGYLYLRYSYFSSSQYWAINVRIVYEEHSLIRDYIYDLETKELTYK